MSKWVIRLYAIALLAYTGWRTFDIVSQQLPTGLTGTSLAGIFLFATEVGLLLWHELSLSHVTTRQQDNIATVMVWVDFTASTLAGVGDMIIHQTLLEGYTLPPILASLIIYGLPITVALNVAAAIYFMSHDSQVLVDKAKRSLAFEIQSQALQELRANSESIGKALRGDIYRALKDDVTGKTVRKFLAAEEEKPEATSLIISPPTSNGRHYNLESDSPKEDRRHQ